MTDNNSEQQATWNRVLSAVLELPGVKVDREAFLRKELKPYCSLSKLDMLESVRPYTIVSDHVIDQVAKSCIRRHTALATTASTIAGLPGGLAMAATIPGDIIQYYYHVVVLSQKLAYLYGFPDFCDEDDNLSDAAADLLTIFMGSMMGVRVADQGINEIARGMAQQTVGRLPRIAITKAVVYPIASRIARIAGTKLTKEGFAKGIGKFVPIAGGLFSGSMTFFTFSPGARRLQKRLKAQKNHFTNGDITALAYQNIKKSFAKAEVNHKHPENCQRELIKAMINMANINGHVSPEKYAVIEKKVAKAPLSDDEKLELLGNVGTEDSHETEFSYNVDYDLLGCDADLALKAVCAMASVAKAGEKPISMAEKMYLTMTAKTIGVDSQKLDAILKKITSK